MGKHNSISKEADVLEAIKKMTGQEDWDGNPRSEPDYTIKIWWIDPYWYICTSDGVHRAISNDENITHEDLIWCVGEQMRLLLLDEVRKNVSKPGASE